MYFAIAFLSLLVERFLGYPDALFRAVRHPVVWIGTLIGWLDRRWNRDAAPPGRRRLAGVAALATLVAIAGGVTLLLHWRLLFLPFGMIVVALLATSLIAQKSLAAHVATVAGALENDGLAGGRKAVAMIVGRDPDSLDETGVSRAAIESLAENFSDGVVAPAFWLAVAGLPGIAAYKVINTADSMIGHRTARHAQFGWAAARLDDIVNLPASRLTALLIVVAAAILPGMSGANAWQAVRRDARKHRSPNAGWPEAAMAGALGLSLAGPRRYGGELVDDAEMGVGGRRAATAADIRRALRLYTLADALLIALFGAVALVLSAHWR
ncbi:cobalamin biosynthesis protein [Nitratireductor mangrovi]|uniref:Cobalamin biosynthesis protein CobD n=1 Tax=Nitratireductor mangrovi TaxID=2599600 RepID=A0A5B8L279_9HYPH|nr:adenosylcobinamide-phosphate synthase CbiB [Nitratireductor mangrovi]QDZ01628.1 cobalamin biosynthesis protein [Nitratireductor mangrovi]